MCHTSAWDNDTGSVARDKAEGNVSCVDLLDLNEDELPAKKVLIRLAQRERSAMRWCSTELVEDLGKGEMADAMRLFQGVAELYADIYACERSVE